MRFALGFDGGGTKTDCVVVDAGGKALGQGSAGPSNPLRVGFPAAFQALAEAAAQAFSAAQLKARDVDAVCAGLAGAGRRSVARHAFVFLANEFPKALAHVTTDCEVALEAAVGPGHGVVLIAGTGSSAFGRNAAGVGAQAGGYGRWVGDEGSAYEIGRRAVLCAARARDLVAPPTLLTDMITAALGSPSWDDLIENVAKDPDQIFPQLFRVVVAAADEQDAAARKILSDSAAGLSDLALAVVRRLEMQDQEFPLVKCGGVFGKSPLWEAMLDSTLAGSAPRARILQLDVSPALGAARLAARLAIAANDPEAAHGTQPSR